MRYSGANHLTFCAPKRSMASPWGIRVSATEGRQIGLQIEVPDPCGSGSEPLVVKLSCEFVTKLYKYHYVDFLNLEAAKEVLLSPRAVFLGVRDYEVGGYCYVGRPGKWYIKERCLVPFPNDKVFAVYLNPTLWLYELQAEKTEGAGSDMPLGWRDRYEELLWIPTTSSKT